MDTRPKTNPLPESCYFDSAGVRLRFIDTGPTTGETVILLHGFSVSFEEQWLQSGVFDALRPHFRIVAIDHRGHGLSDKLYRRADYGVNYVEDLARLMLHLGLPNAHIVGYSMGANIAAQAMTLMPQLFRSAVLAGSPGRWNWSEADEEANQREIREMREGHLTSHIIRFWPDNLPLPSQDEISSLSEQTLAGKDRLALAAARSATPDQVVEVSELAATTIPTLAVIGTMDFFYAKMMELKKLMPSLELVEIQGASHASAPERAEFSKALIDFLKRQPSARNNPITECAR